MITKLSIIAALALTALASSPAVTSAQTASVAQRPAQAQPTPSPIQQSVERPISVDYMNAPLENVIRGLSAFSGRTITVPRDIGNPVVNISLSDVHGRRALDLIVERQGFVAKDDPSGVIMVVRRQPAAEAIKK